MFGIGMQELLVILIIVVVIFGSSRLPQLGEGFGKMISNFRKSTKEAEEEEAARKSKSSGSPNG
jgi:sec-independent protein translocase protein TatA